MLRTPESGSETLIFLPVHRTRSERGNSKLLFFIFSTLRHQRFSPLDWGHSEGGPAGPGAEGGAGGEVDWYRGTGTRAVNTRQTVA